MQVFYAYKIIKILKGFRFVVLQIQRNELNRINKKGEEFYFKYLKNSLSVDKIILEEESKTFS